MLNCGFQFFRHVHLALALLVFRIRADVFWPYFSCALLSAIGLAKVVRHDLPEEHGLDKSIPFGRLFYAIPIGVFATQHFSNTALVATVVPDWMPWHIVWVYLVGTAIIAAALSIILEKHVRLAGTLLGCMFLLFEVLMHVPNLVATHGARLFWMIALRDLAFSGGAFALAAIHLKRTPSAVEARLLTLCRFFVGIPAIVFGVEHFLHPEFTPGVPQDAITPAWIPAHLFWTYVTGTVLIACGTCIIVNRRARLAARCLAVVSVFLVVFVYVPIIIANPTDIDSGLNNLVDILAFSGSAMVLADAISEPTGHGVRA